MTAATKRLLEQAKRMVELPSVSTDGNEELVNYLEGLLTQSGIKPKTQLVTHGLEGVSRRQFNIIGVIGDPLVDRKIRRGLLLMSHLDTLSPGSPAAWVQTGGKPTELKVEGDKWFGLGTADAKLDFLCKLQAMTKFLDQKLKEPIYLVGTCGHHLGHLGARYLVQSQGLNPIVAFVGRPTGLRLASATKTGAVYRLDLGFQSIERGTRGFNRRVMVSSAGRIGDGCVIPGTAPVSGSRDAVGQLLQFLTLAQENGFEFKLTRITGGLSPHQIPDRAEAEVFLTSHQLEDFKRFFRESVREFPEAKFLNLELGGIGDLGIRFLPDALFACLAGVIESLRVLKEELKGFSDAQNEVPESTLNLGKVEPADNSLSLLFDIRLSQAMSPKDLDQKIQAAFQPVVRQFPKINLRVRRESYLPAVNLGSDQEWVQLGVYGLGAAGLDAATVHTPHVSEAGLLIQKGYPALVFGAGTSTANAGGPDEWVSAPDLGKAVRFYESVIERVCF